MIRKTRMVIFMVLSGGGLYAQVSVDEIIEKHAAAIGGVEAWNQLRSYRMVVARHAETGKSVSIATMKRPNKYHLHFKGGKDFIKSYDGSHGWYQDGNGIVSAMRPGEELEMADEGRYFEELALSPILGYQRKLIGTEIMDDHEVFKIMVKKTEADVQYYYLNTSTYLICMTSELSADTVYEGINFKTVMEDYRFVDGLLFPFKMDLYANRDLMRSFTIIEIQLNIDIADAFFEKPDR